MSVYLGIDPGANGGFGVVDEKGDYVDCGSLTELWDWVPEDVDGCALEQQVLRQQDVYGGRIFRLQRLVVSYGECRGILFVHGIDFVDVMPRVWQGHLGIEKGDILYAARLMWPSAPLGRKKDDGRAAGLLLAEYARTMEEI